MKPLLRYTIFILLFTLLPFSQIIGQTYDYPIKPGMPDWKSFTTHDQMAEAIQIPEDILTNLSTKDLVQTCLTYPLFLDFLASDNQQKGIESVIADFNGLQELMVRQNAGVYLMDVFEKMNPSDLDENWTLSQQGKFTLEYTKISILLAQQSILNKLDKNMRLDLLQEVVNKYDRMIRLSQFDRLILGPTIYLMGKIMESNEYDSLIEQSKTDPIMNDFLKYCFTPSRETIEEISTIAKQFISDR